MKLICGAISFFDSSCVPAASGGSRHLSDLGLRVQLGIEYPKPDSLTGARFSCTRTAPRLSASTRSSERLKPAGGSRGRDRAPAMGSVSRPLPERLATTGTRRFQPFARTLIEPAGVEDPELTLQKPTGNRLSSWESCHSDPRFDSEDRSQRRRARTVGLDTQSRAWR